jgi:hypothetical protein
MNPKHKQLQMRKLFPLTALISLIALEGTGKANGPLAVASEGWSVSLDEEQHTLSISHEILGAVLTDVRFNLINGRGLQTLTNWSVEKNSETQVSIRTAKPATAWSINLSPNTLKISSTSSDGVLTAGAPASADRIVARLLDPQGVPVDWVGTHEILGYEGAEETRNHSFLPSQNPEVMYFALGQVSGSNLHSLFDRKTDTAISFSDQTVMKRHRENPDLLEVTIPVPGMHDNRRVQGNS